MRYFFPYIGALILITCQPDHKTESTSQNKYLPKLPDPEKYELVFNDEFEGKTLDWTVWDSEDTIKTSASGQKTFRSKANIEVADGLLKLMVKKESINGSEWTAAFVWLRKVFGPNTYYESKFLNTKATGVNNAFWMACKTKKRGSGAYSNHYEIDCPENKLHTDGSIHSHLAWHDWKTNSYYDGQHIAQGFGMRTRNTDFHTWGLWVGETSMIIYYDGMEQWRGTTHKKYSDQYCSGIGKFQEWNPQEEERAYGKFGQDDWCYYGGYNGDEMNVCFSTIPWSGIGTPLTVDSENCYMGVDYIRIFKLKSDLNTAAIQKQTVIHKNENITLVQPVALNEDETHYFSFVANKKSDCSISISLLSGEKELSNTTITANNEIEIFNGSALTSTETSYPAKQQSKDYFKNGSDYLVVGRITAKKDQKDIISYKIFDLANEIPKKEPFLYHNLDDFGNTNLTSEWDLSQKIDASQFISAMIFQFTDAATINQFKFASNYLAVVNTF